MEASRRASFLLSRAPTDSTLGLKGRSVLGKNESGRLISAHHSSISYFSGVLLKDSRPVVRLSRPLETSSARVITAMVITDCFKNIRLDIIPPSYRLPEHLTVFIGEGAAKKRPVKNL